MSDITINFNGTATIEGKTRFAQDFGGVMIWQMSQDTDDALLFGALRKGLD
jgi:GH18 family chitinase